MPSAALQCASGRTAFINLDMAKFQRSTATSYSNVEEFCRLVRGQVTAAQHSATHWHSAQLTTGSAFMRAASVPN